MKLNVAVIFGGKSTEHEVSVISALQAIENIDKEKYNVFPVYIDKKGDFYYSEDSYLTDSKNYKNVKALISKCKNIYFVKDKNYTYIREVNAKVFGKKLNQLIDAAFPVVHGTNVEDGNLQGYFHTLNLPVVGPDTLSAALSMDKYVMKEYCKSIGVPVIDAIRIDKNDYKNIDKTVEAIEKKFKYPVIIKPINLGSSIGISKAKNKELLLNALELAFTFSDIVLVEKAIENMREINCAVVGDKFECETSVLEEPFGNDEILSFADKYMSGSKGVKGSKTSSAGVKGAKVGANFSSPKTTGAKSNSVGAKSGMASLKRRIPAEIDEASANRIRDYAKIIFKYLGCSGVSRIDFIIDKDTNTIYANEINAIPGSLSYYLFEPLNTDYKTLLDKLINIAINNYKNDERLSFTFDNDLLG